MKKREWLKYLGFATSMAIVTSKIKTMNKNEIIKEGSKIRTYDFDDEKMVSGVIGSVFDKSFMVKWEDLSSEVEYDIDKVKFDGNKLIEL